MKLEQLNEYRIEDSARTHPGDRHRLSARDAAVLLVGAARSVGEPFDLYRAIDRCDG